MFESVPYFLRIPFRPALDLRIVNEFVQTGLVRTSLESKGESCYCSLPSGHKRNENGYMSVVLMIPRADSGPASDARALHSCRHKIWEAGELVEARLGMSAMGKHRDKPFDARPGPHMPPAMHGIGMDGHKAASEFATAAKTGDRDKALALLPNLTSGCVACHYSYRTR